MATIDMRVRSTGARSPRAATQRGVVATYSTTEDPNDPRDHETLTRAAIAKRLAGALGYTFAGEYDAAARYGSHVYLVPADTLVGTVAAAQLHVRSERDVFGGVVPHAFIATKAITHTLVNGDAAAPDGWSPVFAHRVADSVLPGFTAFSIDDARRAGERLLENGTVRIKRTRGIGGHGQFMARDARELDDALDAVPAEELASLGIVLELHLADVRTYSVGQFRVGDVVASYWGTQRLTENNKGAEVYGGSELFIMRGEFEALAEMPLADTVSLAIAQARVYDAAANECFAGFIASRRNYDVAQGRDALGRLHIGVLEQSWRIGGASGAEVVALEAFLRDPALRAVSAASWEIYGNKASPPAGAQVLFDDIDRRVGRLTKYVTIDRHADAG